jgi:hypothetical protein
MHRLLRRGKLAVLTAALGLVGLVAAAPVSPTMRSLP